MVGTSRKVVASGRGHQLLSRVLLLNRGWILELSYVHRRSHDDLVLVISFLELWVKHVHVVVTLW